MAIFTIGDLHLSLSAQKPMDIFGGWQNYVQRLEQNWRELITPQDTVVLAGDISWAMKLEDCKADFAFLQALPGKKLLMKGNHDYWWTTANKMKAFLAENGFDTLDILHNNAFIAEGTALCGTRGWMFEADEPHDEKIMNREVGRLRASLQAGGEYPKAAFLHYPPLYGDAFAPEIIRVLQEFGVKKCFYGHLHGRAVARAIQGEIDGIAYKLISADALEFRPYLV